MFYLFKIWSNFKDFYKCIDLFMVYDIILTTSINSGIFLKCNLDIYKKKSPFYALF